MEYINRHKMRLPQYDYAWQGCYFITICTQNRKKILSDICGGAVLLRLLGRICNDEIMALELHYPIKMEHYAIMPNHIHLLLSLRREEQSSSPTIIEMMQAFKSKTTKLANQCDHTPGRRIWQRSFYDHVVRNEQDYAEIWKYIDDNPIKWELDKFYRK